MSKSNMQVMVGCANGDIIVFPVKRVGDENTGFAAHYMRDGKDECVVFQPEYRLRSFRGIPTVGQLEGSTGAVSVFGPASDAPGDSYGELMRSHYLTETVRTMNKGLPWKLILLVVVGIIAVVVVYKMLAPVGGKAAVQQSQQKIQVVP